MASALAGAIGCGEEATKLILVGLESATADGAFPDENAARSFARHLARQHGAGETLRAQLVDICTGADAPATKPDEQEPAKVRVYALAKGLGVSSAQLLGFLEGSRRDVGTLTASSTVAADTALEIEASYRAACEGGTP